MSSFAAKPEIKQPWRYLIGPDVIIAIQFYGEKDYKITFRQVNALIYDGAKGNKRMAIKTTKQENIDRVPVTRQAFIPDDLSYMTETEYGQEMLKLAAEIAEEQGTRTTEEISQLIDLMRGSASADADLS